MSGLNKDRFETICRLCTSSNIVERKDIFQADQQPTFIGKLILELLQISIENEDLLPKFVCAVCASQLEKLNEFKENCLQSESKLYSCLKEKNGALSADSENQGGGDQGKVDKDDKASTSSDEDSGPWGWIQLTKVLGVGYTTNMHPSFDYKNLGCTLKKLSKEYSLMRHCHFVQALNELALCEESKLPVMGDPGLDDYVLMKEETFTLESNRIGAGALAEYLVEFNNNHELRDRDKDRELLEHRLRKEVLPPMWDVYEKTLPRKGESMVRVAHRRYVISKLAFSCSLCGECFRFDQGCERDESPSPGQQYSCLICGKVFPRRGAWKRHQATHEDTKPYCCRICGNGFNRKEHLTRHLLSHAAERPFRCDVCHKPFLRKEHLTRHHATNPACSPARPFPCTLCGLAFIRKEHLLRHYRKQHEADTGAPEPKPFTCETCNKTFSRREHLRRHQAIHEREMSISHQEPADGDHIIKSMMEEATMETDSIIQANTVDAQVEEDKTLTPEMNVTCDLCKKHFSRRSHLWRHLKQVHGLERGQGVGQNGESHTCKDCGKEFVRRCHLERHCRTHKPQPYECVTCGEKFTQSALLDSHMTVHGNTVLENYLWV